ncbi:hypothetical protein L2D08_01410 [Domibacillus sp. PGB-M46]|uniref:hypothetical protein n=1 Tax=Domibacillus sp. PGB-M46 TaxID=2910255 RepID=UPI001F581751|nr:hypothetical protein [Domibacillus sp. PGB-M46]MCI2253016.1 hypothetical protein [Domibacillus sp. PGB-M46]
MKHAHFFSGRELTDEEIPILSDVHSLAVRPGLSRPLLCHRCGNTSNFSSHPCARCGTNCAYCRNCIQMGKISSCTTLYRWIGPSRRIRSEPERCTGPAHCQPAKRKLPGMFGMQ